MKGSEQVGGDHYSRHKIQPLDIMRDWYDTDECAAAMMQNVLKYLCRYRYKNGIEDLHKAADYLARLIAIAGAKQ